MSKVYIVTKATSFDDEIVDWAPTGIFETMEEANAYIDREISAYRKGGVEIDGEELTVNSIDRYESGARISGETATWYCNVIISIDELEFQVKSKRAC